MPRTHPQRWTSPALGTALVAVTVALTSACMAPAGADGAPITPGGAQISTEQQTEMADGVVTSEEYHEAFRRFSACMADAGFEIVVHGEKYDLIEIGIPDAAVEAGVDATCYDSEWKLVDMQWQLDHFDTSYTAEVARQCLLDHGLEVPERYSDMVTLLEENGVSSDDCPPVL